MHVIAAQSPIVSPKVYALILTSPRLQRMLLPEGLVTSPYEILNYESTLILHDPEGIKATFVRTQQIRFLQDGVSGILDHAWGDGVVLTSYEHEAGELKDSFRDEGRRHLVVGLKRSMRKGEVLAFGVARGAMVGFTGDEEWLETTLDHPAQRLSRNIVFPRERPCQHATLHVGDIEQPLPVTTLFSGRTAVRLTVTKPQTHVPYIVRWSW